MSENRNQENQRYSNIDPWEKIERQAESEPGKKERMPSNPRPLEQKAEVLTTELPVQVKDWHKQHILGYH